MDGWIRLALVTCGQASTSIVTGEQLVEQSRGGVGRYQNSAMSLDGIWLESDS